MKKYILTAVAAGGLALGGAASAQDLGQILGSILGYGTPTYPSQVYPSQVYPSQPAVVAGTQPYGTVYVDQYGRQVMVDQYGRQVLVQPPAGNYGTIGYDAWGRPIHGTTQGTYGTYGSYGTYGYAGRPGDRDGDGVANINDRWPDDRRYW